MPSPCDLPTNTHLLRRVRDRNDQEAWGEFVGAYGPFIARCCRDAGVPPAAVDDLAQEVFVVLIARMQRFSYDPSGRFRAWLRSVVHNVVRQHGRALVRRHTCSTTEDLSGPAESGVWQDRSPGDADEDMPLHRHLHLCRLVQARVRARVAARTWEAFELTEIWGLTCAAAGAQLGMEPCAVAVARLRVRDRLRDEGRKALQEVAVR